MENSSDAYSRRRRIEAMKKNIRYETYKKRKMEAAHKFRMSCLEDVERTKNPNVLIHKFHRVDNFGENDDWEELFFCDELSDEDLLKIYSKIKPLVVRDGSYYNVKDCSIFDLRRGGFLNFELGEPVDMNSVLVTSEFSTYHEYGKNGIFSPTVCEVLQQFPKYALCESNAFCIATFPKTLERVHCHVATVKALKLTKNS